MGLNNRQEDVHALFLNLFEHFEVQLTLIFETFSLPYLFDIHLRSTITCQHCKHSSEQKVWESVLSLKFPLGYNEDAQDGVSHVLHITSLMDTFFKVENLYEHTCLQCTFVGGTEKKLNIVNAPQVLVLHLARFTTAAEKIDTFVEFMTELATEHIRDRNGLQMRYRLVGIFSSHRAIDTWTLYCVRTY